MHTFRWTKISEFRKKWRKGSLFWPWQYLLSSAQLSFRSAEFSFRPAHYWLVARYWLLTRCNRSDQTWTVHHLSWICSAKLTSSSVQLVKLSSAQLNQLSSTQLAQLNSAQLAQLTAQQYGNMLSRLIWAGHKSADHVINVEQQSPNCTELNRVVRLTKAHTRGAPTLVTHFTQGPE